MTVPVPSTLTFEYLEDGTTTVFSYPVRFLEQAELLVIREIIATGVRSTLILGADYTVSGAGNPSGGSITRTAATNGGRIIITRKTQAKQVVDLADAARTPADSVEVQLDRLAMVAQDHQQSIDSFEGDFAAIDAAVAQSGVNAAAAAGSAAASAASASASDADADRSEEARDVVLSLVPNAFPPTRTVMKGYNPAIITAAYLKEQGREGMFFVVDYASVSALVALDTEEAFVVRSTADPTKAFMRIFSGAAISSWWGPKGDGVVDDRPKLQKAIDLCLGFGLRPIPLKLVAQYFLGSSLIINRPVGTSAGADTFLIMGEGSFAGFKVTGAFASIDSTLPFTGAFNQDPPSCNIAFDRVTWLGNGGAALAVSDKFVKVHFEACRFNQIKCVLATYYLQSWRWHYCSAIAWPGIFCSNTGRYYDCHWDNNDWESGGDGIKSFNDGFYGSSITNNLFENSGRFFSQSLGMGTTIIGNYTEGNSAPDYQLSDPVNFGSHAGTVFKGNVMLGAVHALHNVIVGSPLGFDAGGNATDGKLYDVTNTPVGSFSPNGDYAAVSKFSAAGFIDRSGAGTYVEASLSSTSATGLVTGAAKTITSVTLQPGEWDVQGVAGYTPAGSTSVSRYSSSISLSDNAVGPEGNATIDVFQAFVSGGFAVNYPTPTVRLSLAVATTVYLVGVSDFTVSTMAAFGRIRARKAGITT